MKNTFLLFFFLVMIGTAGVFIFQSFYGTQESPEDSETQKQGNIYTRTVDRTRDSQLRADATRMVYALKAYQINNVLPSDFPSEETCVGISPPCYNLEPLLVPTELEEIPIVPGETEENTGFYVKKEGALVVVGVEGNLENSIEIKR